MTRRVSHGVPTFFKGQDKAIEEKLAIAALEHVNKSIPINFNHPHSYNMRPVSESKKIAAKLASDYCAIIARSLSTINRVALMAEQATRRQSGNCGDYAAVQFMFLEKRCKEKNMNIRIEICLVEAKNSAVKKDKVIPSRGQLKEIELGVRGDHAFIVIGREQGSDINDPMTWGRHAIICDGWDRKYYLAKDYLKHLKNFHPQRMPDGSYFMTMEPIDLENRHRFRMELDTDYAPSICSIQ